MGHTVLLLFFLSAPVQDDASRRARELVEKLGSDRVEEREEAANGLKELGRVAFPALEKAAKGSDVEMAKRAQILLKTIPVREALTRNFMKQMPGVDERLALGEEAAWTLVFREAIEERNGAPRYPAIDKADLEAIAGRAVNGARTTEDKEFLCREIAQRQLRSASSEIVKLLKDPHVRNGAAEALGDLDAKETVPDLIKLLQESRRGLSDERHALGAEHTCWSVAQALQSLEAKEAVAELLVLLRERETVSWFAGRALGHIAAPDAVPELAKLLSHEKERIRWSAARALGNMEATGAIPDLLKLLRDGDGTVRKTAASALVELGSREGAPLLLETPSSGFRLAPLNLLRKPQVWVRLRKKTNRVFLIGTGAEILKKLAKDADLALEIESSGPASTSLLESRTLLRHRGDTLLESVLEVLGWGDWEMILENDRLRLLPLKDALKFWRAWWQDEQAKMK